MSVKSYQFPESDPYYLANVNGNSSAGQQPNFQSRVIAVASGKGGVGKTSMAVNMALVLAKRGIRVVLLDADLGTANVDVMLGLRPRYHLHHVITGQKSLADIIVEGPFGLKVIPGASGLPDLADMPDVQRDILLRALMALDGTADLLLIDTGAGVGRNVIQFILAAGELLLVTTPEPTAITDAYALMKVLASYQLPVSIRLVVNNATSTNEGKAIGRKLNIVAEQFLGRSVDTSGIIPYDRSVQDAVRRQVPLVQASPYSASAIAIGSLAEAVWNGGPMTETTGISRFFKKIMAFRAIITE